MKTIKKIIITCLFGSSLFAADPVGIQDIEIINLNVPSLTKIQLYERKIIIDQYAKKLNDLYDVIINNYLENGTISLFPKNKLIKNLNGDLITIKKNPLNSQSVIIGNIGIDNSLIKKEIISSTDGSFSLEDFKYYSLKYSKYNNDRFFMNDNNPNEIRFRLPNNLKESLKAKSKVLNDEVSKNTYWLYNKEKISNATNEQFLKLKAENGETEFYVVEYDSKEKPISIGKYNNSKILTTFPYKVDNTTEEDNLFDMEFYYVLNGETKKYKYIKKNKDENDLSLGYDLKILEINSDIVVSSSNDSVVVTEGVEEGGECVEGSVGYIEYPIEKQILKFNCESKIWVKDTN